MKRKKLVKSIVSIIAVVCLISTVFVACSQSSNEDNGGGSNASVTGKISVISREDGSGTRGAFTELFEIVDENKNDITTASAETTNSTGVMMSTVAGNKSSIGYISLGSLNDTIKAIKIDGVEATTDNVKNGSYKVSRPFNIVIKDKVSETTQDFINYIMSADGQKIVSDNGYISSSDNGAFEGGKVSGNIKITGSSSVTPVMEKLAEAYNKINPNVTIDIMQSDSTIGIQDALNGNSDIGMASRELKENETGVNATAIALDGIAVIVNKENSIEDLSSEQVKGIYTGEITEWSQVR